MALPIFLRPSTKLQEIDLTQRLDVIVGTMASVTGEFERGPIGPMYQRGYVEHFKELYGLQARPDISFAHDTVTQFMRQSGNVLVNRVAKNALYSGLTVYRDRANGRVDFDPFTTGSPTPYDAAGFDTFIALSFTGNAFTSSNGFTLDVTDGVSLSSVDVDYDTDHNTTLQAIADEIKVVLDQFVIGGSARVVANTAERDARNTTILIRVPKTTVLEFLSPTVSGSAKPVVTMDQQARMFDVYSENPGAWSDNQLGVRLSNIDPGVRERYRFTMSQAFQTGNTITLNVNGTPVTQAFDTNSDATLAAFAAKLTAHADIASAEVESVPNGNSNDRSILIIAAQPKPNALQFGSLVGAITGGSSRGVIAVPVTMTGSTPDNTFYFEVVERANVSTPENRYEVSLQTQLSRLGYQQNIAQLVNVGSRRSELVRVAQPAYAYSLFDDAFEAYELETTIAWLRGGTDGVKASSADIRAGIQLLSDRRKYPMDLVLNAGYTAVSVQKEIQLLCEKRSDCMGVLDAPSDKQQAQVLREYRRNELDIDSSYVAMYAPDCEIEDDVTAERRFIPPSGIIGATYAYSDRLTNGVGAPAGLNRGKTPTVLGLRYYYTEQEQELIYPVGINYIEDRSFTGPVVMAEETLQFKKSIMSSVHARRIMNRIKVGLTDGLDYTLFDPNTDSTRFRAIQLGESLLAPMKRGDGSGGLYDYRIKCDSENNDGTVIDADQLAYAVFLKIVRVIKGVGIKAILTPTGSSFEEFETEAFF